MRLSSSSPACALPAHPFCNRQLCPRLRASHRKLQIGSHLHCLTAVQCALVGGRMTVSVTENLAEVAEVAEGTAPDTAVVVANLAERSTARKAPAITTRKGSAAAAAQTTGARTRTTSRLA